MLKAVYNEKIKENVKNVKNLFNEFTLRALEEKNIQIQNNVLRYGSYQDKILINSYEYRFLLEDYVLKI